MMVRVSLFSALFYENSGTSEFDRWRAREQYQRGIDHMVLAEKLGFDAIYFSEHHAEVRSLTPSPNLLVAALSQRTERAQLGVLVNPTPLYPAWRLAEEFAMLDHLTCGRLEIGLGPGIRVESWERSGIRSRDDEETFRCKVQDVTGLLDGSGGSPPPDAVTVFPSSFQSLPRIWIPAATTSRAAWAARAGYELLVGATDLRSAAEVVATYLDNTATRAGRIALRRRIVLVDEEVNPPTARADLIVGNSEQVGAELARQIKANRCTDLLVWFDFPGMAVDTVAASLERFRGEVLPYVEREC